MSRLDARGPGDGRRESGNGKVAVALPRLMRTGKLRRRARVTRERGWRRAAATLAVALDRQAPGKWPMSRAAARPRVTATAAVAAARQKTAHGVTLPASLRTLARR